ncbi:SpoIIE family protein phosphatase [Streptomyces sp. NPDC006684]|uniref:SpoIIE family protein phosphatase n=1 Tax=Streptomyces sp. NPDC006684 TaxID=3154477 RepID=UPI003454C6F6
MPPPASTDRPAPQLWQDGRAAGGAPSVLRPRRPVTDPGSGTAPRTATAPRPGAEPRSGMDRGELDSLLGALRERRSSGALPPHVGSAEWDLLTDGARCSAEFAAILGRDPALPAPGLDELPSYVHPEDRAALTTLMTGCLVDGRKLDGTLRLLRADGSERTVRLLGEPVLDAEGCTASLWLVVRETAPGTARRAAPAAPPAAREEYRVAVALRDSVLPPWQGPVRFPSGSAHPAPATADDASRPTGRSPAPPKARRSHRRTPPPPQTPAPPARTPAPRSRNDDTGRRPALDLTVLRPGGPPAASSGHWYEAAELPDGSTLLAAGEVAGHGLARTTGTATLLGALRGIALTGAGPGALLDVLGQVVGASAPRTPLASALCCRVRPDARGVVWAQAGHAAPLLFRAGTGRSLKRPAGHLLGAPRDIGHAEQRAVLAPGDLLVLRSGGPVPAAPPPGSARDGDDSLLALAPRLAGVTGARDAARVIGEALRTGTGAGAPGGEDCLLIALVRE